MDDIEFKKAANFWLQQGLQDLAKEKKGVYTTRDVIDLESTADTEVWDPSSIIREIVPNVDSVDVELVARGSKLNDLNKKLLNVGHVGLVVMGSNVSRNSRPSLIILTTDEKLYAIDVDDVEFGMQFLMHKLRDKNLEFWTTNGINEADSLYHNFQIDLMEDNVNCCTGLHIHMMQLMRYKTESGLAMYPLLARQRCRNAPKIENFGDLIEIWLDIPRFDFNYDKCQLAHLNTRPFNQTAINLIKKRCVLVCSLIKKMKYYSWLETMIMSRNAIDRLTMSDDERIRAALIRKMNEWKELGECDFSYFIHLDTGIGM